MRLAITAYADDCVVSGQIDLDGVRLSDALERLNELRLHHVTLRSLADGRRIDLPDLVIERDELLAVEGHGTPTGESERRVRTVRHMLQLQLGPYTCFGELHALPGVPPLSIFHKRRTMVPLTSCVLVYREGEHDVVRRLPTLIVNVRHVEHVDEITAQHIATQVAMLSRAAEARGAPALAR